MASTHYKLPHCHHRAGKPLDKTNPTNTGTHSLLTGRTETINQRLAGVSNHVTPNCTLCTVPTRPPPPIGQEGPRLAGLARVATGDVRAQPTRIHERQESRVRTRSSRTPPAAACSTRWRRRYGADATEAAGPRLSRTRRRPRRCDPRPRAHASTPPRRGSPPDVDPRPSSFRLATIPQALPPSCRRDPPTVPSSVGHRRCRPRARRLRHGGRTA